MIQATESPEKVTVLTSAHDLGGTPLDVPTDTWVDYSGASVRYIAHDGPIGILRALAATSRSRPEFLYLNSLLNPRYSLVPLLLARCLGRLRYTQVILAPRGELDPGALSIKPFRKRIYIAAGKRLKIFQKVVWQATNPKEKDSILRIFPGADVRVHPNQTSLPTVALEPKLHEGPLRVIFLSRIAPIKGLDIVLRALTKVDCSIVLNIYGNEEDDAYSARCHDLAAQVPNHVKVHFHGVISHDEARTKFWENDLFAFPTAGENFGHAIVEALSSSRPVLLPDTTPWSPIARRLGTLVEARDPDAWARALEDFGTRGPLQMLELQRKAGTEYETWCREAADRSDTLKDLMSPGNTRRGASPG